MIKNLGKLCLTLCLLVAGGVVANAQIDGGPQIEANITFAFMVGDTKLPAGKYEIKTLDAETSPSILELRSADGRTSVVFDTQNAQRREDEFANKTELVFDKVGDQYFLSQIWVSGSASGSELPKSRMEKRLAGDGTQPEKHSIVAFMKHLKP
ncbi:MAG TPA: hypothetical protein VE135_25760 [Pyrinomonadaceae bacterium]|nr:hypothetical protein [Pyrinomonadaceae bacterium]